jgi:hypothetical protein
VNFDFLYIDPKYAKLEDIPAEYIEAVKTVHQHGGYGSQGYFISQFLNIFLKVIGLQTIPKQIYLDCRIIDG